MLDGYETVFSRTGRRRVRRKIWVYTVCTGQSVSIHRIIELILLPVGVPKLMRDGYETVFEFLFLFLFYLFFFLHTEN